MNLFKHLDSERKYNPKFSSPIAIGIAGQLRLEENSTNSLKYSILELLPMACRILSNKMADYATKVPFF